MAYAPTGVAAFQVGGSTGNSLLQLSTGGKMAFGHRDRAKGESMRKEQGDLSWRALHIGDELGMVGRPIIGRQEYNADLAPSRANPILSHPGPVGQS